MGMHFVLTLGRPLSAMPGLTRDGQLWKWIWELAEQMRCRSKRLPASWTVSNVLLTSLVANQPHIDSHHHVHMIPAIFPLVADFTSA